MTREEKIKWREVPFEIMLKCDGEIICKHWLLYNRDVDLESPMYFGEFIRQISFHLTDFNCKSLFQQAKWYVIDDGVQPDFFIK